MLPERDCTTCTDRNKEQWGCVGPAKQKVELDGVVLTHCPMRLFLDNPDDIGELFWYYTNYKRGQLPLEGGLLDQPAKMMDAFRVIDGANATLEVHHQRKQQAEARAAARKGR